MFHYGYSGVLCGRRPVSCAVQLVHAVRAAYEAEQKAAADFAKGIIS